MRDDLAVPAPRTLSPTEKSRQGRILGELIAANVGRRRLRRPVPAIGIASVAVATMGAGVAAYVGSAPATDHTVVHCFTSLGTRDRDLGTDTNYLSDSHDAIETCANLWRAGVLQLGKAQAQVQAIPSMGPLRQDLPAPPLVACTLHGEAAVFPGDAGTCRRLGLPTLGK
jgi:hypothetical protein